MTTTITPEALERAQVAYSRALTGPGSHVRGLEAAILAALPELLAAQPQGGSQLAGYYVPNARVCSDGSYEDGPGGLVLAEFATDKIRQHGEPVYFGAQPASSAGGQPVAKIHRDGYWTNDAGRDPFDRFGPNANASSMAVYAAPVAGEAAQLRNALERIERWELPETGETWPSGGALSYEAAHGSNGVRDYIRGIARQALAAAPPAPAAESGVIVRRDGRGLIVAVAVNGRIIAANPEYVTGPAAVPVDGEILLFALNSGFGVTKNLPASCLTDAANTEMAWSVSRVEPPFCDPKGIRTWTGPTPTAAVVKAATALGMKLPNKPAAQGVDLGRAIDIVWTWQSALGGHVYDGRDVARTLITPDMESIGVNPDVLIGIESKNEAVVIAKREIIRALIDSQHQQQESTHV